MGDIQPPPAPGQRGETSSHQQLQGKVCGAKCAGKISQAGLLLSRLRSKCAGQNVRGNHPMRVACLFSIVNACMCTCTCACTCTRACACCACICGVGETTDGQLLQVTTAAVQPAPPPAAPAAAAATARARARHSASSRAAAAQLLRRRLWLDRSGTAADVPHSKFKISIRRFSTCRTRKPVPNAAHSSSPATAGPMQAVQWWPPLTLRLTFDSASASCRIMHMTMCNFTMAASTNTCWQAGLLPVQCCSIAPEIHSKLQTTTTSTTSSCSSGRDVDDAASTISQPAISQGRRWQRH